MGLHLGKVAEGRPVGKAVEGTELPAGSAQLHKSDESSTIGRREKEISPIQPEKPAVPPPQLLPTVLQSSTCKSPDPNNRTTPFTLSISLVSC